MHRSGMLPGHISGFYTYDECHVDLSLLATFAKARLVVAPATHIDWKVRPMPALAPRIGTHESIHVTLID